jgi:hypothetical protein
MQVLCAFALSSLLLFCPMVQAGARAEYLGGTLSSIEEGSGGGIDATDGACFIFTNRHAAIRIPWDRINLIEYGQRVNRRYALAILVSPLLLLAKKRTHFLTVGFTDDGGKEQAMIFRVDKNDIRRVLVSLEARTGRKVEFQDEEARKAGKG